jgi:DMSO/TMAO reductase YedYZ heme-binding membrane subunit
MALKGAGITLILATIALVVFIALLVLSSAGEEDFLHVLVRFFALYGYLFLSIAVLTTPFLKEITQAFGKPFLKVHHAFSIFGLVFITLHPVFNAVDRLSLSVFVPRFDSWNIFWMLAGRPAFFILYIAFLAAVLRVKAPKYWRYFHALMYVVLLFGIVHANLIGDDFQNPWVMVMFNMLFAASIASFLIKRYLYYQLRMHRAGKK